jgi:hypothetical protein
VGPKTAIAGLSFMAFTTDENNNAHMQASAEAMPESKSPVFVSGSGS